MQLAYLQKWHFKVYYLYHGNMFLEQNNQLKGLDIISSFFWFHEIIKDGGDKLRTYLVKRIREYDLTI